MSGEDSDGDISDGSSSVSAVSEDESDDSDFDDTEYKNWVRGAKSLEYLQQGLAPFVDREIAIKHNNLIQGLQLKSQACANCNCTYDNLLPDHAGGPCNRQNVRACFCFKPPKKRRQCPNGKCGKIHDFIVCEHRFTCPSWGNSDISKWSTNAWSIAQCFMPESKYPSDSAKTTDATGLLSIMINAMFLETKFSCNIGSPTNCISEAREKRNELLHKAKQELTDQELHNCIDLFVSVLQDPIILLNDQDAMLAVVRLNKLKNGQIHIDTEERNAILKKTLETLEEERIAALNDIESSRSDAIETIDNAKTEILQKLEKYGVDAAVVSDIKEKADNNSSVIKEVVERLERVEEEVKDFKTTEGACKGSQIGTTGTAEETMQDGSCSDSGSGEDYFPPISTDNDEIEKVDDTDISLRKYQAELAEKGSEGNNVIVLAPTNTGKTRVVCKIIQDHFRRRSQIGEPGRVIFLVHNEALAFQQGAQCAKLLPAYRTKVICGRVQREKKQYLKEFVERRDILVSTAQVLVNDLNMGHITSLAKFSMIVIDECHHTMRSHSFNQVMSRYFDMKLGGNYDKAELPQIVGLTASLGVGGNTDYTAAKEHMKKIIISMDAHFLSTVKNNVEDLQKIENRAKEYTKVSRRRSNDSYRKAVMDIFTAIDVYMISHRSMSFLPREDEFIKDACRVPLCRGSVEFMRWLAKFKEAIAKINSDDVRRMVNPCRQHLKIYNKALFLYSDARVKDAMSVITGFMEANKHTENDTDIMLQNHYERLQAQDFSDEPANPKLSKLEKILMHIVGHEDARCIIFVKYLELVRALTNWINENDSLRSLLAAEFVGQGKGGMTKLKQKDVLEYFKNGRHKVIVATSVAEEGLDVTACNLVIRYEHVTNEIVRLQSRGRARAKNSRYYVLTEEGSSLVEREEKLAVLEQLMNRILPQLRTYIEEDPVRWKFELKRIQKENKLSEKRKDDNRQENITDDVKQLRCFNCNNFICLSSDIRRIMTCHYISVDENITKKLSVIRYPVPRFQEDVLKYDGRIYCGNVTCQNRLGGVCEYQGTAFPMIAISHFRVVGRHVQGKNFKKWKDVNFKVDPLPLHELKLAPGIRDDDF